MLDSLPITILISTALGFLAGIGVGGGSLLLLWLTLVIGMDQNSARIINLCFFLPSAIISILFRRKDNTLNYRKLLPGVIAGCISTGVITALSKHMDAELLKKGFGILLLVTGIRELFYKPKASNQRERKDK